MSEIKKIIVLSICILILIISTTYKYKATKADTKIVNKDIKASLNLISKPENTSFTIYQLPPVGSSQIMSYAISTDNSLFIIDGGTGSESKYLEDFINSHGNKVDAWFITHPHPDHVGALTDILNGGRIIIDKLYHSLPKREWIKAYEPEYIRTYDNLESAINNSKVTQQRLELYQKIIINNISITILLVNNPEITRNAINNSSLIFKIASKDRNVLFLGDAGLEEGKKLINTVPESILKSEFVQMAHHGQNGVGEEVYKEIAPEYCLWPTPKWLWDNDAGKGYNSGKWKTIQVRSWMKDVKKDYTSFQAITVIN